MKLKPTTPAEFRRYYKVDEALGIASLLFFLYCLGRALFG